MTDLHRGLAVNNLNSHTGVGVLCPCRYGSKYADVEPKTDVTGSCRGDHCSWINATILKCLRHLLGNDRFPSFVAKERDKRGFYCSSILISGP